MPSTVPSSLSERVVFFAVAAVVAALVLYPIGILIGRTVIDGTGSLSLLYWRDVLSMDLLGPVLQNTAIATIGGTAGAVVLGTVLAFIVVRTDLPFSRALEVVSLLPFVTPPIIAGMAWQLLGERRTGIFNLVLANFGVSWRIDIMSLGGVVFVSALYLTPFVFLMTCSALRSINPDVEEAGIMSGAGPMRLLWSVTLPLLAPALSGAAVLVFLYANTLFGIHATLGMPVNLWFVTTLVYRSFSLVPAQFEQGAVLSCLLMILGIAATILQMRLVLNANRNAGVTGKGFRKRLYRTGRWKWIILPFLMIYLIVTIALPYLVLFLRSLRPYLFLPGMSWADVLSSWKWEAYVEILTGVDEVLLVAIVHSFVLAAATAVLAPALAVFAAYISVHTRLRFRSGLSLLFMLPLTMPGIVLGVSILIGYSKPWAMLYGTLWILLVAYVVKDLPLCFRSLHAAALSIHPELEESARSSGAGWWTRFRDIILPLLRPGIVIAALLTFVSVFREVAASIILYTQGTEVIAYALFNFWENGSYQKLSAFIMVTTVIVLIVILILMRWLRLDFDAVAGAGASA